MAATLSLRFSFSTGYQLISTVLLWHLLLVGVDGQNQSTTEVQALLKFKEYSAPNAGVVSNGYWSTWNETDKNPCGWAGVTCTSSSTVEQLNLKDWRLTQLPSLGVLSSLKDLRELDLSNNDFQTTFGTSRPINIPDDIGLLVGLTRLDLSESKFSGPIPRNISACRSLQYISLEKNALTGELPDLSSLVNLKYLLLTGNRLGNRFPTWLGKLSSPLKIDLSANNFTGAIPSLSNLTNLLQFHLDNNSFTGFEGVFLPDAKLLGHLTVSGNQLEGPIPPNIFTQFKHLKILDMARNRLSGDIPSEFPLNMGEGLWIELSYNQLTGSIPRNMLQPNSQNNFNDPGLLISHNRLSGHIPFDKTQEYTYNAIDFSYNNLSGPIPFNCFNRSQIFRLSLQNNHFSGDIVDFLANCFNYVTDMQLANNSLSGDLSRLANITVSRWAPKRAIDLSNNNLQMSVTEAYPDPFGSILDLLVLNSTMEEFRIQGNNFSGTPLPASLRTSADSLQVLDISNNHLVGEISDAAFNIMWLPELLFLNLSNNDATGAIPEAIAMLTNLTVLDVTNNKLSGPLPALPGSLYYPSFYAGNDGLCGGPLDPCSKGSTVQWWVFLIVVGGSIVVIVGSCLVVTWRWRVYRKLHEQDADLIKILLERESAALMSLSELKKATNNFDESAQIGEGGFGTVYTGTLNDGTMVAIKRSKCEGSRKEKDRFLNEVRILSQVNHRHLVKLMGCCMENKIALLVFEFVSNGTLQQHLQGKIGGIVLSWKQRLRIAVQTADALTYLHSAATFPIYHRDVKSANILLDTDLNAKVADFGISKLAPLEATHVSTFAIQGTIGYMDPEYYTSYRLTDKSDVYSFGVVLLELISARPAVDFLRGGETTGLVSSATVHIQNGDVQQLVDVALLETYNDLAGYGRASILNLATLAMKCLNNRSKARPSMHEVWKELQNIWVELQSTPVALASISHDGKDLLPDHMILLSDSSRSNSSNFSLHSDPNTGIQLSQISPLKGVLR